MSGKGIIQTLRWFWKFWKTIYSKSKYLVKTV